VRCSISLSNWESETRAVVAFAHIGLETIPAAAALRKLRRVTVGGSLGMVQSV
jgi:hypothetical protein